MSLVYSQQGHTLHSHAKDVIHQDSAVGFTATWSTVSKAVPYTDILKILYFKTVQSLLQLMPLVYSHQGHTQHHHAKDIIHKDSAVSLTAY